MIAGAERRICDVVVGADYLRPADEGLLPAGVVTFAGFDGVGVSSRADVVAGADQVLDIGGIALGFVDNSKSGFGMTFGGIGEHDAAAERGMALHVGVEFLPSFIEDEEEFAASAGQRWPCLREDSLFQRWIFSADVIWGDDAIASEAVENFGVPGGEGGFVEFEQWREIGTLNAIILGIHGDRDGQM